MRVKSGKKEGVWTIDLKKVSSLPPTSKERELTLRVFVVAVVAEQEGKVYEGPAKPKADVTISLSDEAFENVRFSSLISLPNAFADGRPLSSLPTAGFGQGERSEAVHVGQDQGKTPLLCTRALLRNR